ncbi:MAG: MarR family transcriptional regulator [Pseudomonadota bacterium]|nr:MarR family transcriptional regulator [Pseudomonadota bacterium]
MDKYRSESQQRVLRILTVLAGHEVSGLAPGEIAKGTGYSASNVTRALANLRIAGLAEQLPDSERWRLSPKVVQIAIAHMSGLDKAQGKLDEVRNRFSRNPH